MKETLLGPNELVAKQMYNLSRTLWNNLLDVYVVVCWYVCVYLYIIACICIVVFHIILLVFVLYWFLCIVFMYCSVPHLIIGLCIVLVFMYCIHVLFCSTSHYWSFAEALVGRWLHQILCSSQYCTISFHSKVFFKI